MTRSQSHIFDGTCKAVFEKQPNLGAYAKVSFFHTAKGSVHVIYDRDAQWIETFVRKTAGDKPDSLNLQQIKRILGKVRFAWGLKALMQTVGLKNRPAVVRGHHYFDSPDSLAGTSDVLLLLAAKQLFEKYTRMEARMVSLRCPGHSGIVRTLVVKNKEAKGLVVVFDVTGRNPDLHLESFESGLLLGKFELADGAVLVNPAVGEWTSHKKSFSLFGESGQELSFQITGRTPAEKRFEKDEEVITAAQGQQLVPIELNYHPFWRPLGHTTLRIGRRLFELSATGWKAHNQGANTARAFIFNNPFFRKQLRLFADQNIAPMSVGVTLLVAKDKVDTLLVILENLAAAQGTSKEKFSLLKNNCNQGIVRVLTQAGIEGFDHKGYLEFSTVLTYRELLLNPRHPVEGLRVYPLPNTVFDEAAARKWIPTLLYRNNTVSSEVIRALPVFPRDFFYINWKRLQGLVMREGGQNVENN